VAKQRAREPVGEGLDTADWTPRTSDSEAPLRRKNFCGAQAQRGTVVVTTMNISMRAPASLLPLIRAVQSASLRTLTESGVTLAIGSDNVSDSSLLEAEHLYSLGVVDRLALLKLWAEDTPRAIFPQRRIGFLREGYQASFLALEGNPLDDWRNVRRIKLRFKPGLEVH
jgi:predicted amidohydrolase YtcJ